MSVQDTIKFLPPEPIVLLPSNDEDNQEEEVGRAGTETTDYGTRGLVTRKHRASSSVNSNFNFSRVCVSDCTILKGDNNSQFAMWKITILLQPSVTLINTALDEDNHNRKPQVASPQIQLYKRYSDFELFRRMIVGKIQKQGDSPDFIILLSKIPKLPPKVPWYDMWQYRKLNYNKKWLIERRIGLETFLNGIVLNRDIVQMCRSEILQFLEYPTSE
ncbi:PX domain-containing protein ypt35 [Maudiozyma exigua]|uniref:PX domain-containing protein ypt35 n=1 Tax=Maudiozyma exigua TaxID=34358 RepID=A0A9P6W368_MAUEX|nr:PX domain-containing protein ypt35 [Kazachstania exigua]